MHPRLRHATLLTLGLPMLLGARCGGTPWVSPHEAVGRALYASPQADPIALSPDGSRLYVANTTSDTVSIMFKCIEWPRRLEALPLNTYWETVTGKATASR